jgi:hypothetical protein
MKRSCKACDFWDSWDTGYGQCRFNVPNPVLMHKDKAKNPDDREVWWPLTKEKDWCGHFKPKE